MAVFSKSVTGCTGVKSAHMAEGVVRNQSYISRCVLGSKSVHKGKYLSLRRSHVRFDHVLSQSTHTKSASSRGKRTEKTKIKNLVMSTAPCYVSRNSHREDTCSCEKMRS